MAIEYQEERDLPGRVGLSRLSANGQTVSPAATPQRPRFYSVPEAAGMLGMAPVTVYRAIRAGEFPAVQVRGRLIIPAKAIDAMIEIALDTGRLVDASAWPTGGVA